MDDASVSPESDHISVGAVIRDEKRRILGAMAKSVEETFSPLLAECIALRESLMMAKELESVTLVVETDAINVVSVVSDNTEFSLEGPILEDVKQLLAQLWNPAVTLSLEIQACCLQITIELAKLPLAGKIVLKASEAAAAAAISSLIRETHVVCRSQLRKMSNRWPEIATFVSPSRLEICS
ncbi:hypothetical protein TIFTF001_026707 [Ficus carica]|uniref:RNase H type-1 domain-containing protein n=1 Tax=Ficus carica TaxID=3494 RepID=A0AA88DLN8_FICCA|nr:hypothetical protein TIFTF001_026707 [Ficus carica]